MKDKNSFTLEELSQIEEIKLMKSSYCRYVDTKQWDKLSALLDEKIEMDFRDPQGQQLFSFDNRKDMISLTSTMLASAATVHHVHNPEIKLLSPNTAEAIWAMEDLIVFPEGSQGAPFKTMHGFGHYYETMENTAQGWVIKSLRLERIKLDYTH